MDYYKEALRLHEENKGKLAVVSKTKINTLEDLSLVYTPGVGQACLEIKKNPQDVYKYTSKGNMVAVITDGSAVLGLGNIGPAAALPVMEGKCVLFKEFADVNAFPICLDTQDTDEIVFIAKSLAPSFGGINLEDIAAPRCFEVEKKLQDMVDIPVFHDDQHGTAVVTTAGLINALKLVKKDIDQVKVVINGAGAAGTAIAKMFLEIGIKDILCCARAGILAGDMVEELDHARLSLGTLTNPENIHGTLADAIKGADVFIGVSGPGLLTKDMVKSMNQNSIIFAMANPEPEIQPVLAKEGGAAVIGTGRSDYPNQINNVSVFPGIFKGALEARAKRITGEMKIAAAYALAGVVADAELGPDYILPSALRKDVASIIAKAVADAWKTSLE